MSVRDLFKRPEKFSNFNELSPAQKAKIIWDEREGNIIVRNHNLRKLVYILLVIVLILVGCIVYLSSKSSVQPFVVMANPENGEIWHVGTVAAAEGFEPNEAMKKYFVTSVLKNMREMPLDPIVYNENTVKAFHFMTRDAVAKVQGIRQDEHVAEIFGRQTVTVNVISVLPMEGGNSFQVRWTEDTYNLGSETKTTIPYTGIFTTQIIPQKDEKVLANNPISFYITEFSMTRDTVGDTKSSNPNVNNPNVNQNTNQQQAGTAQGSPNSQQNQAAGGQ